MKRLVIVWLLGSYHLSVSQGLVPDSVEFGALKQIFDSLDGPNWTNKTNWPVAGSWPATATSAQFGTWRGITVSGGDIIRISLANNKLKGKLPSRIQNLTPLTDLIVHTNQISGPLPHWINKLINLTTLYVQSNQLSGTLPTNLCSLTKLRYLDIRTNPFTGSLPTCLNGLAELNNLFVSGNQFTGPIPDLSNLTKLTYIILSGTFDYGPLPEWLGRLTELTNLTMPSCRRTGYITETLRPLRKLGYLDLSSNQLTGPIPKWIGEIQSLSRLFLQANSLTGEIPDEIGQLTQMQYLYLYNNRLTGELPASIGNLNKLIYLQVHNNLLSGRLPASLGNLSNMTYLQVSGNLFNGAIPQELMNLNKMVYAYLYSNEFTSCPNFTTHPNKANLYLRIDNNRLSFESIEPLFTGVNTHPFKSITVNPQKKVRDVTQITAIEEGALSVSARPRGTNSTLVWEYAANGTTWAAATGNQDVTGGTFYRAPATKAMAGSYRWRMSSTKVTTFTVESDPIVVTVANGTQQFLDNWAFQYKYDYKNRMTAKRVPGADWVFMVYDSLDRLILTQDGNQRPNRQWLYTKYDALDRPVMTGIYTHGSVVDQAAMAKLVSKTLYSERYDGSTSNHGYTNTVWPTTSLQVLTVTYYDDYAFKALLADPTLNYQSQALTGLTASEFARTKGLVTGSRTRVLGRDQWITAVTYFDDLIRMVQSVSTNPRGGYDRISSVFDFLGKVTATRNEQSVGYIDWVMKGVDGTSSRIHKSDRNAGWNAGASSAQQLAAGADGWLEFVFPENTTQKVIGLSDADVNDQPSTIDYGIGLSPSPLRLEVWENGVITALSGTPVPGELLRIERKGGTVKYWRNGVLVRTAPTTSATALIIDASFNHADASVAAVNASFAEPRPIVTSRRLEYDHADRPTQVYHTLEGATVAEWTKLFGVEKGPSGGLRKTTAAGWGNAGASSSQLIPAGADGYVEITVKSTSGNRLFGLSQKDENAGIDKVDFGILLTGGSIQIYERGTNRGAFGPFAVGDVLRVQRILGQVTYRKNNTILFTSSTSSATSLVADVAIETTLGEMEAVRISLKGKEVLLSDTRYNAIGNAVDKKLHSTDNGAHVRQSVDYRYNIRGWITQINNSDLSPHEGGDPRDLFGMELGYSNDLGTGDPAVPQFNGNISAMKWSANLGLGLPTDTKERSYNYTYDAMNRILSASFRERKAVWSQDGSFSESGYTYDNNGNILSLTRKGAAGLVMDALSYDYGGGMGKTNRLLKVGEGGDRKQGFREGTNTGMDYGYDANGNMISDANKDITSITYNHLNLPSKVTKVTGDYVCYLYDAGGRKLGQWVYEAVPKRITKTTDYLGECIYENDALQLVQHEEGRVVPQSSGSGAFDYQYHLKDHLGNVRLTFSSKVEKDQYLATLETDRQSEEQSTFQNYSRVSADLFDHTDAGLGYTYAQRLTGGTGAIVGLAKSLKVEPGDTLQVEAFAKYLNTSGGPSNVAAGLAAAIAGAFGLGPTAVGEPAAAYNSINSLFSAGSLLAADPGVDPGAPKAFLNILLFDGKYNLVDLAYDQISAFAKQEVGEVTKQPHDRLYRELVVSQPGYAYIYVSNENPTLVEVYFDDLTLTHRKSPVVQWDDYYPFGMGINSISYQNCTLQKNDFLYNGKERQDELGIGWLDYGARMYMAEIGRWGVIDGMIEKHHESSTYTYVYNNPIRLADIMGLDSADRARFIEAVLKFVDANPGGTYKSGNNTATLDEHSKGAKLDCAGLMRSAQIAIGNPDPISCVVKWEDDDNAVKAMLRASAQELADINLLEDGNYVTFKTDRGDHKGPDGKFDHIGVAYDVVKDDAGKVVSFKVAHSFGKETSPTSGPGVTNYSVASPKGWLELKAAFKWDKEKGESK
jgi:RHS repeat-associated protein